MPHIASLQLTGALMTIKKFVQTAAFIIIFAGMIAFIGTSSALQALSLGLIWGVMATGVWVTFRVLNFADLTTEGSFILGAGITARLIVTHGADPLLATLVSVFFGMAAGAITGFFHTVMKIPPLLSGILTMTGLYSVTLRVMGPPNIPIVPWGVNRTTTVMTRMADFMGSIMTTVSGWFGNEEVVEITTRDASIAVGIIFVIIILVLLRIFFNTELGYAIRATGDNEAMVKAQGINSNLTKVIGLALGNACIALSGALVFQAQGFADVNMGFGIIVIGIASVIIGEVIFSDKNRHWAMAAVIFGSIIYRIIIAFVLEFGVHPNDVRLATALMIAVALSMPMLRERFNFRIKKMFWGDKRE